MARRDWTATYRLQLHRGFPLAAAAEVLPYLAGLGISHVYLSPCLQAAPGSEHGYDVVDPTRVSDDLGGEAAWDAFQRAARAHGLGVLLDIVPNHMSTHPANAWWMDVLRHGPYSGQACWFDLDPCAEGEPWRLRLCTLPRAYGELLRDGGFALDVDGREPWLTCDEQRWPLNPLTWHALMREGTPPAAGGWRERLAPDDNARRAYDAAVAEAETAWSEQTRNEAGRAHVREAAHALARDADALHALIEQQYYRPCSWRLEGEAVNYRRFFNIGSLVGVRMEDPEVFAATHARIARMAAAGEIAGVRVDHPDGLRDPAGYLRDLRQLLPAARIYVEKILDAEETLPEGWPVDGTVGYDFLSKVNRLWMAGETTDQLTGIYADFTGHTVNFPALVREKKLAIIDSAFGADRERLVTRALALARRDWRTQDLSRVQVREALQVLTAILPVYRTYLPGSVAADRGTDLAVLEAALAQAAAYARRVDPAVFEFLRQLLSPARPDPETADFIARWQQLTPAVMAKGSEDTTFYLFDRLVSANEVGAQPSALGISAEQFHAYAHRLQTRWPRNLLATSTHDNKRSEDVRVRISLLSEMPDAWAEAVQAWSRLNHAAWRGRSPDRHAEYLLYQTLVGAWPIDAERARQYMLKACREAKVHTSWHEPRPDYEEAITGFVTRILESRAFVASLEAFVQPLLHPARVHSLAQTLIKLTAPGVPDLYQGTEGWDLSLVDPDNRRPVDFARYRAAVERCREAAPAAVLEAGEAGVPKLWMIARVLGWRKAHAAWLAPEVSYEPLVARGTRLAHVFGFQRGDRVVVLVPRFVHTLRGDWGDTRVALPPGAWTNLFSGTRLEGEVHVAAVFAVFPVALLFREDATTEEAA